MFEKITPPLTVFGEWFNPAPMFGVSLYTRLYYEHIGYSVYRAYTAFLLAVVLGVPLGLLMGWRRTVYNYTFPLLETLRPIPPLAWVPLAILMLPGIEPPVIYVTFIAAFFATVLNTLLGVLSIDESYFRAAQCLGRATSCSTSSSPGRCPSSSPASRSPWASRGLRWWPGR